MPHVVRRGSRAATATRRAPPASDRRQETRASGRPAARRRVAGPGRPGTPGRRPAARARAPSGSRRAGGPTTAGGRRAARSRASLPASAGWPRVQLGPLMPRGRSCRRLADALSAAAERSARHERRPSARRATRRSRATSSPGASRPARSTPRPRRVRRRRRGSSSATGRVLRRRVDQRLDVTAGREHEAGLATQQLGAAVRVLPRNDVVVEPATM